MADVDTHLTIALTKICGQIRQPAWTGTVQPADFRPASLAPSPNVCLPPFQYVLRFNRVLRACEQHAHVAVGLSVACAYHTISTDVNLLCFTRSPDAVVTMNVVAGTWTQMPR